MIRTNIHGGKYSNIFEYPNIQHTMVWKYDTNEYLNIFGSKKWYERIYEYIRIKKRIRIWYERIFGAENIRIYSNIRIFNTLWYEKYDTNEYPNIFGSKKWYERIYEYIRIKKRIRIWYERIFVAENIRIYSNIRIFVTLWLEPRAKFEPNVIFQKRTLPKSVPKGHKETPSNYDHPPSVCMIYPIPTYIFQ